MRLILCLSALLVSQCLAADPALYTLTWTSETFPTAIVEARFGVTDGEVRMSDFWATFFEDPGGWTSFVRKLEARDSQGRPLSVAKSSDFRWRIGDGHTGIVTIQYEVDFAFAGKRWPVGNEQVALHTGQSLYTTGLPLFIHPPALSESRVRFRVPRDWKVATSWPRVSPDTYHVPSGDRLLRNAIVIGRHHQETLETGGYELRMALLGEMGSAAPLIRNTFQKILEYFVALFDDRQAAQFLMVVMPGPNDGEAFFDSFASSQPEVLDGANRLVWANSLAHEFFHYWNGKKIGTEWQWRAERQWFSEGFSEYYANRALRDLGIIDEPTYLEIISQYLSLHLLFASNPYFAEVTMKQAGAEKWRHRPGVYDSGAAAAFCLDGLIRERSGGERSLDDMMRGLNVRFGRTGKPYRYEDLVAEAGAAAGSDLSDFFADHISGKKRLPVASCAARSNLRALIDGYHVFLRTKDDDSP